MPEGAWLMALPVVLAFTAVMLGIMLGVMRWQDKRRAMRRHEPDGYGDYAEEPQRGKDKE